MEEIKDDNTEDQSAESAPEGQEDTKEEKAEEAKQEKYKQSARERISDITQKFRGVEEKLSQRDQDFELLRTQNDALQGAIDNLTDKVTKGDRPDPNEDPEAYDTYIMERMQRKQRTTTPPRQTTTTPPVNTRQQAMEDAMAAAKDDYYQVIAVAKPDIDRDRVLYNQIWGSPNPYQAAYKYGTDKAKRANQSRDDTTEQGYVEGETIHTDTPRKSLSAAEKQMAANLGIKEENYLKQREFINNDRSREV